MKLLSALFGVGKDLKFCIRRICGTIGFLTCLVLLFIPDVHIADFRDVLYVSAALLGLTAFDKLVPEGKNEEKEDG